MWGKLAVGTLRVRALGHCLTDLRAHRAAHGSDDVGARALSLDELYYTAREELAASQPHAVPSESAPTPPEGTALSKPLEPRTLLGISSGSNGSGSPGGNGTSVLEGFARCVRATAKLAQKLALRQQHV